MRAGEGEGFGWGGAGVLAGGWGTGTGYEGEKGGGRDPSTRVTSGDDSTGSLVQLFDHGSIWYLTHYKRPMAEKRSPVRDRKARGPGRTGRKVNARGHHRRD